MSASQVPSRAPIGGPGSPLRSGKQLSLEGGFSGYARGDVLKKWYGYDNQPFLDHLAARKFFIASKAKSNYCQTGLSLSSTLNMGYLTNISEKDKRTNSRVSLIKSIYANAICRKLRKQGYKIVAYSSGYHMTAKIEGAIYPRP